MKSSVFIPKKTWHSWIVRGTSGMVGLYGLYSLTDILISQLIAHHEAYRGPAGFDVRLLAGLGLVYLSVLLLRRKHNAWQLATVICLFMLGLNGQLLVATIDGDRLSFEGLLHTTILLLVLGALWLTRQEFTVRSDVLAFRSSLQVTLLVLLAVFLYGVVGFTGLDHADFHQEISLPSAALHTVDQFALVSNPPTVHTKRARLFVESLRFVSIAAVSYATISFFQPVRSRYRNQRHERDQLAGLLGRHHAPSEDFFKLWPHDKQYFIADNARAGLAYRVHHGVALVQGDPVGSPADVGRLLDAFGAVCARNDWTPAYIHIPDTFRRLYEARHYRLQCIGREAIVELDHFTAQVAGNKFFRNVRNRFTKAGYTTVMYAPPHSDALLAELRAISDSWLERPGRSERGFVMGYFNEAYLQQCRVFVARDQTGAAQAFLNLVPAPFDTEEATYDLLRSYTVGLNNSTDFLLMNLIVVLQAEGYKRLNFGLSPLAGLLADEADSLIDTVMAFAYANGDRFYSFSGLYRFKNKYEPQWSDRYIAYQGAVTVFTRVMRALLWVMKRTA